jgi:serine/threonine protein kinase
VTAGGGIRFGTFTLFRRLARGGMAEVFLARQIGLEGFDRRVAMKRILPHLADSGEFIAMFLREARLAARLSHPNIVHIYDFGKVGSDYFIAMEFVDGVTAGELIARCAKDPMPAVLVARIGADAATALHYAHELRGDNGKPLGLVHRDVSPANVMVSHDGVVKVVDFGIAKAVELTGDKTNPGTVKGKYAYMSPEQTIAAQLDGRSDVFSLSIVLWEIVAGRPIVERGDRVAAMRAIRDGRLPQLDRLAPSTPRALVDAISWGLARRREERPNAAELAQALEAFIKASPELATSMHVAAWVRPRFQPVADGSGGNPAEHTAQSHTSAADQPGTMDSHSEEDLAATIPIERMSAAEIFGSRHRASIAPRASGRATNANSASGTIAITSVTAAPSTRRTGPNVIASPSALLPEPPVFARGAALPSPPPRTTPMGTVAEAPLTFEERRARSGHRRWLVVLLAISIIASAFAFTLFVAIPLLSRQERNAGPPPSPVATPLPIDPASQAVIAPGSIDAGPSDASALNQDAVDADQPVIDAKIEAPVDASVDGSNSTDGPEASTAPAGGAASRPRVVKRPTERTTTGQDRPAILDVIARPADVAIAIDNLPPQRSPARFTLPAGPHRLRVHKPGYDEARRAVDLTGGQRRTIELTLPLSAEPDATSKVGNLSVRTNPSSEVFLGSRALGSSPIGGIELAAGSYTLSFKQAGRTPVTRRITIRPGENLNLNVDLP